MPLMQPFSVQTFQDFSYCFLANIHRKILVFVQQVASELDIKPVRFPHVEEILRAVAIQSQELYLTCQKRHSPADLRDLASNILNSLFSFGLLGG